MAACIKKIAAELALAAKADGVEIEIRGTTGGGLAIELLHVPPALRREGRATRVMEAVCKTADLEGVDLFLIAAPLINHDPEMDSIQLEEFYARFGFEHVSDGDEDEMVRYPCPDRSPAF